MDKAPKKQIIRRTEQEKLALIEQWEKSGLPVTTFCRQHHFSDSLFHSWLNKYRRSKKQEGKQEETFIPLHFSSSLHNPADVSFPFADIVPADGKRIKLYQAVSADYLRTLIS